ncbi:hypothetical protein DEJ50_23840 [Streptomyces venezuelae]|uniref:DUF4352 domain-containing protein n=1 Tax=Streptomyces venezuelae TaxID=54571 RepID=A0A5P2D755_STRVZ|nr:DUF4352 domain-containing protein [Streptomyces venezuelae]QES50400.1 hypothetical protein DEJ50_23840 [Streptomyces venezuelae]
MAIGLGIAGVVKARRGSPRKGMAIAGIVLGALALPAAAGGVFFTVQIADELEERSDRYERNIDDAYDDGYDDLYGAPEPTASPTPSDLPGRTKPLAFGQTFRYDDGVEVTVKEAKGYKPEPNRYLPDRPKFAAKVTVTITNNSDKRIEVRLALPSARDDKGLEATRMYDAEVYKPFDGSLLPGQSATGVFGYGLPEDSKGLQFEIDPGPSEYEGAIWSGALS